MPKRGKMVKRRKREDTVGANVDRKKAPVAKGGGKLEEGEITRVLCQGKRTRARTEGKTVTGRDQRDHYRYERGRSYGGG